MSCIADTYLMYLFFSYYFDECVILARSKGRHIFYVIFASVWFVSNLLENGNYNLFISATLIFLYVMLILQGRYYYKLLCYLLLFVIQFGCEFLFMLLFQPDAESYKNSLNTAFQMIIIKFFSFLIIVLITQFTGRVKMKISRRIFLMYLCLPIASISLMIANFYAGINRAVSERLKILILLGYAFLFVGNIVVFYAFYLHFKTMEETVNQKSILTKQEADIKLYNKVIQMNEKQKELVHNAKHYFVLIKEYAVQNDVESILQMITQLSEEIRENEKMIFTKNSVLNAILNEKYEEAQKYGIDADFYVEPGISIESISSVDLICMVGNLLDNALRAARSCIGKKFVKVYVYMQDVDGFCVVKVVNGFSEKLQYKNEKLQTTKSENGIHGIGIQSVERLADKYGGMLVCIPNDNIFEAILILSTIS